MCPSSACSVLWFSSDPKVQLGGLKCISEDVDSSRILLILSISVSFRFICRLGLPVPCYAILAFLSSRFLSMIHSGFLFQILSGCCASCSEWQGDVVSHFHFFKGSFMFLVSRFVNHWWWWSIICLARSFVKTSNSYQWALITIDSHFKCSSLSSRGVPSEHRVEGIILKI
jgi:hypothetical protein